MNHAVYEAVAAYNADPTEDGVSPQQCVTGRQPSGQGSVLNNFAGRLAEHGVIYSDLALREAARVAMVRQKKPAAQKIAVKVTASSLRAARISGAKSTARDR